MSITKPEILSETDVFIIRFPNGDGAVGPIKSIHFDRSPTGGLAPNGTPRIIYSVGSTKSTCTLVLDESDCPQAREAYATLMNQALPLNFAQTERDVIPVGSSYTFDFMAKDGKHNLLRWVGHSPKHPFFGVVDGAFNAVAQCGTSADTAFHSIVF